MFMKVNKWNNILTYKKLYFASWVHTDLQFPNKYHVVCFKVPSLLICNSLHQQWRTPAMRTSFLIYFFIYPLSLSLSSSLNLSLFIHILIFYITRLYLLFCLECFFVFLFYVLSHVWLFVTPWTIAHYVPLSMEFFS